jgi:glutamate-1-semialdehyde 2,1-aminomutase
MALRDRISDQLLARALATVPAGAQTDAKTVEKRLAGVQPSFFVRGKGAYAQEPDGTWWLDCQMGLGAYILGYSDPLVNRRVSKQLRRGSIFSLASVLELEVAEKLLAIFPEFKMVRFAKNGSDVTSAAVRISRSYTGREHVIGCGYHGFQDWSMTLRSEITGIPTCVRSLTQGQEELDHRAILRLLDTYPERFAAVIIDAGVSGLPRFASLREIQAKCREAGTVLILDEIVSGFRAGPRGIAGLSGIVPDMLCLGKALANGFPLAALIGSEHLLALAPSAGMTATFAGDCIALAAAQATIEQLSSGDLYKHIQDIGTRLIDAIRGKIEKYKLDNVLHISGYPGLAKLLPRREYTDGESVLRFMRYTFAQNKIFWQGSFVLCRDFGEKEFEDISRALDECLSKLQDLIATQRLQDIAEQIRTLELDYLARVHQMIPNPRTP